MSTLGKYLLQKAALVVAPHHSTCHIVVVKVTSAPRALRMPINLVVAVTDDDWFETLRRHRTEVNFWAPSAANFPALEPGELFLFKLHAPRNVIVGGGVFAYANALPCSLAWAAFGEANGAGSAQEMRARIARYRRADPADRSDFPIGCRILTQPFFFEEADWIPVPVDWSPNIVSFKTYNHRGPLGTSPVTAL
jgi:putative restriction endonuclease